MLLGAPLGAQSPANVLLVVIDDLSAEYLGCYQRLANPPATPVVDRLANEGIRFDNAYANPVCSPSRACLLTGRHAFRSDVIRVVPPGSPGLPDEELLLPEALAGSGRALALIGKWHLGARHGYATPNVQGWPHFVGAMDGALPDYWNWPKVTNGQLTTCTNYATTDQVDEALAWIRSQQQPWLLYLSFNSPHTPRHAPPAHLHHQDLTGLDPIADPIPFHLAMVESVDQELGRLLQELGPVLENTNVIVLGDNGTPGEVLQSTVGPYRGKGSLYEAGIMIPLIVNGPAVVAPGRVSNDLVHILDLYPTLLELCDVDPATAFPGLQLDGVTLMPLIENEAGPVRTGSYSEVAGTGYGHGFTLREGQHKLIRFADAGAAYPLPPHEELYDLAVDPLETNDLLAGPTPSQQLVHTQLVAALWDLRRLGYVLQFGSGCSGQAGPIRLRTFAPPTIGFSFATTVSTPAISLEPVMSALLMGWSREWSRSGPLPIDLGPHGMPGCPLLISDDAYHAVRPTSVASHLFLPNHPMFLQSTFYMQGFALDPTANATGMVTAPAYQVVIGQ